MATRAQKEHSITESTSAIRDGLADETNNTEHMEKKEKGHKHIAKRGSQKRELAGAE